AYLASFGLALLSIQSPESYGTTYVLQFAISIGLFVLFSNRIAAAYRFGTTKGCAAIVLSVIAMALVACVCSFILPSVMVSLNGSSVRP
ncbi:MAG: hypothetical protein H7X77_00150, partial [Anaerolineae bacterium]|nr:hypothetical protein [Anaerolineae bacterium]